MNNLNGCGGGGGGDGDTACSGLSDNEWNDVDEDDLSIGIF